MPPEIFWDPGKARANLAKHGVDFADAALVLEDAQALTIDDPDHDEPRFRTLGADPMGRLLVVVYAMGLGDAIRLISARRASRVATRARCIWRYSAGTGETRQ